jgi:hypothetical protein
VCVRLWRHLLAFRRLPWAAQRFYLRAGFRAVRARDSWSLRIAVRPLELEKLLELAESGPIAEIGSGTGWCALLLASCGVEVFTCDPHEPPQRRLYLPLVSAEVARRVRFSNRRGEDGAPPDLSVVLLFLDASHTRDETISVFRAWEAAVAPGGAVAFHDYTRAWPEVAEAVDALGLEGTTHGALFVWQKHRLDDAPDDQP